MGNRTLTQEYALYAYDCIKDIKKIKDKKIQEKYSSRVKKLPAMITHNGLLTTLTFLYSKSEFDKNRFPKNAESLLLQHIISWLKYGKLEEIHKQEISSFIEDLAKKHFQDLMLYSRRTLTLAQWLKRLAEGEFEDAKDE